MATRPSSADIARVWMRGPPRVRTARRRRVPKDAIPAQRQLAVSKFPHARVGCSPSPLRLCTPTATRPATVFETRARVERPGNVHSAPIAGSTCTRNFATWSSCPAFGLPLYPPPSTWSAYPASPIRSLPLPVAGRVATRFVIDRVRPPMLGCAACHATWVGEGSPSSRTTTDCTVSFRDAPAFRLHLDLLYTPTRTCRAYHPTRHKKDPHE